jgi:hypothetical protein
MLAGSLASSHHGRPRSTNDADIVIDPTTAALENLVAALARAGFYVDSDRAHDALRRRRQFNVIDGESAYKIDLIIRKDRAFSGAEFARRATVELLPGLRAPLASAEDTVLAKLEWARLAGGSEKQLGDVRSILEVKADLDVAYIERWARELGVVDLWQQVQRESP